MFFDIYYDHIKATWHHETAWRMLSTVAEKVGNLPYETLKRSILFQKRMARNHAPR